MTGIRKIKNADPEVWEMYPEIHHYTSIDGLKGILDTQVLFATHYDHLNDSSELRILRDAIPKHLEPTVHDYLMDRWKLNSSNKREIRKFGGIPKMQKEISESLGYIHFDAAFSAIENAPALTAPYITSFCGLDVDSYEQRHGLLSQWRGYAKGGFSLVFDTEQLWNLCRKEIESYAYATIMLNTVIYDDDELKFEREIGPFVESIKQYIDGYLRGESVQESDNQNAVANITQFARLKHRAFTEEKEVRIVACPISVDRYPQMAKEHNEITNSPVKEPRKSDAVGSTKPQIELFDAEGVGLLPIKRIIVGPQKEQGVAIALAQSLVDGTAIKVSASETPFIER